jgi:transposase-like protein
VHSREQIVARVLTGQTAAEVAAAFAVAATLGLARSTVARWLRQVGPGLLAQLDPPAPARRHQRARSGELIHLDIQKPGRFGRPGHRVTGR